MEKVFVKYKERGSMHWRQMMSRDVRFYNAVQQARYDWIQKSLGDLAGKYILDIGCGDGGLTYCLARAGVHMVGIDNEALGIDFAKNNIASTGEMLECEFVVGSAYELPFPDDHFDHVVSCEVIEHVNHPEKMIAEARRVLRPGGLFVLTTPYRLSEFPGDPNHVREYYPTELEKLCRVEFSQVEMKLTHHTFWFGLYTYTVRPFKRRHVGMWIINALALWFGYNPFMIAYPHPTKWDKFHQILLIAKK